jgi:hypothetical protein
MSPLASSTENTGNLNPDTKEADENNNNNDGLSAGQGDDEVLDNVSLSEDLSQCLSQRQSRTHCLRRHQINVCEIHSRLACLDQYIDSFDDIGWH